MRRRDVLTMGVAAAVAAAARPERAWSAAMAKDLASDLEPMTGDVKTIGKD